MSSTPRKILSILHIFLSNFARKTFSKLFLTKGLQTFGNINVNFATVYSYGYINNSRKGKLWNRQPFGVRTAALTWQVENFSLTEENTCIKAPKLLTFMTCETKIIPSNVNKFQHFG